MRNLVLRYFLGLVDNEARRVDLRLKAVGVSSSRHALCPRASRLVCTADTTMRKDKESIESLTANAEQTAEQITKQTQDYFGWLQKTMSVPWSHTNLNRILLNQATQSVTATFAFVRKLSQAKNFQDIVKIQTEFMATQMKSFNEQGKILGELYSKAAEDAMKSPFGTRK